MVGKDDLTESAVLGAIERLRGETIKPDADGNYTYSGAIHCPYCNERLKLIGFGKGPTRFAAVCPKEYLIEHPQMLWVPVMERQAKHVEHRSIEDV